MGDQGSRFGFLNVKAVSEVMRERTNSFLRLPDTVWDTASDREISGQN
jgi:hypothetical protein